MQLLSVVLIRARPKSSWSSAWNGNTISEGLENKGQDSRGQRQKHGFDDMPSALA